MSTIKSRHQQQNASCNNIVYGAVITNNKTGKSNKTHSVDGNKMEWKCFMLYLYNSTKCGVYPPISNQSDSKTDYQERRDKQQQPKNKHTQSKHFSLNTRNNSCVSSVVEMEFVVLF